MTRNEVKHPGGVYDLRGDFWVRNAEEIKTGDGDGKEKRRVEH